ncbi:MAG: DUF4157 domain-containing protein, partial [Myxococcota bacterium]
MTGDRHRSHTERRTSLQDHGKARQSSHRPGSTAPAMMGMVQMRQTHGVTGNQLLAHLEGASPANVQMTAAHAGTSGANAIHRIATAGVQGPSQPLPHLKRIQASFGRHDITTTQAHIGGPAHEANAQMGSLAYATGSQVAFKGAPDLHTAAHEAAHVIQQRGGVQLKEGVGRVGDRYEQHADAVADRVVQGKSAEALLDTVAPRTSRTSSPAVQHRQPDGVHPQAVQHRQPAGARSKAPAGGKQGTQRDIYAQPFRVRLAPSPDALLAAPQEAAPLAVGLSYVAQLIPAVVRALVGDSQYNAGLGRRAVAHVLSAGMRGVGNLSGKATKGQRLSPFRILAPDAETLITWLRAQKAGKASMVIRGLSQAGLKTLQLGPYLRYSWQWLNQSMPGKAFPAWMNLKLFRLMVSNHGQALATLRQTHRATKAAPADAKARAAFIAAIKAIHTRLQPFVRVVEAIRTDHKLVDLKGYRLLFQLPQRAPKETKPSQLQPVSENASMHPAPAFLLSGFITKFSSRAKTALRKGPQGRRARRTLLGLVSGVTQRLAANTQDKRTAPFRDALRAGKLIHDQQSKANAPPFPATLTVHPEIDKRMPAVAAGASYHFRMNVRFPDVYAAYVLQTRMSYRWELVKVSDKALAQAREWSRNMVSRSKRQVPSELGPMIQELKRQQTYAGQDMNTLHDAYGMAGIKYGGLAVMANRGVASL